MVHIQGSGLYNWDNTALVTSGGELLTTGSTFKTPASQTQDVLIGNDGLQLLTEILKQTKIINFQLMNMNNLQIKEGDIEI